MALARNYVELQVSEAHSEIVGKDHVIFFIKYSCWRNSGDY